MSFNPSPQSAFTQGSRLTLSSESASTIQV